MALSILESILRDHWAREVICEQGCTLAMDIIMKLSDLVRTSSLQLLYVHSSGVLVQASCTKRNGC